MIFNEELAANVSKIIRDIVTSLEDGSVFTFDPDSTGISGNGRTETSGKQKILSRSVSVCVAILFQLEDLLLNNGIVERCQVSGIQINDGERTLPG